MEYNTVIRQENLIALLGDRFNEVNPIECGNDENGRKQFLVNDTVLKDIVHAIDSETTITLMGITNCVVPIEAVITPVSGVEIGSKKKIKKQTTPAAVVESTPVHDIQFLFTEKCKNNESAEDRVKIKNILTPILLNKYNNVFFKLHGYEIGLPEVINFSSQFNKEFTKKDIAIIYTGASSHESVDMSRAMSNVGNFKNFQTSDKLDILGWSGTGYPITDNDIIIGEIVDNVIYLYHVRNDKVGVNFEMLEYAVKKASEIIEKNLSREQLFASITNSFDDEIIKVKMSSILAKLTSGLKTSKTNLQNEIKSKTDFLEKLNNDILRAAKDLEEMKNENELIDMLIAVEPTKLSEEIKKIKTIKNISSVTINAGEISISLINGSAIIMKVITTTGKISMVDKNNKLLVESIEESKLPHYYNAYELICRGRLKDGITVITNLIK